MTESIHSILSRYLKSFFLLKIGLVLDGSIIIPKYVTELESGISIKISIYTGPISGKYLL